MIVIVERMVRDCCTYDVRGQRSPRDPAGIRMFVSGSRGTKSVIIPNVEIACVDNAVAVEITDEPGGITRESILIPNVKILCVDDTVQVGVTWQGRMRPIGRIVANNVC